MDSNQASSIGSCSRFQKEDPSRTPYLLNCYVPTRLLVYYHSMVVALEATADKKSVIQNDRIAFSSFWDIPI
ncbi:hypothetical protein PGT21_017945 [Puccinia graminis f. sp. tritici]|uniref:Uncharacterized protein n=2 Tax=Puccinia graminis f. sp. tritici TaxID=56615 RepID=H6QU88_PUCGT|nr:uncharacterized protein PGTG_22290 [Puccinia graminis f. sp. tritici CRL 75-36-700-3]EHS64551.1 hypothetical protein PGTG_22290 [Puccinia graminis f. sp. tritici CRL 75-36-700-3]KAA1080713.1 hypothetical protein PGT21_017945 [Puccinia graminis f. sp. tritici]KAA1092068.1 hypothetical protein PGTUg99_011789 [Puccinia graminis f. sp. tritici]